MPSIPCDCDFCAALSDAIDRRRSAIAEGRDVIETRAAVRAAGLAVDAAHGLDRKPLARREMTPPGPPDPEPPEDGGWFESAGQLRTAAVDAVARRVGLDR